jgi:anaerobic carbon-monoxide dehydrogenase iron sulfur subunit
MVSSSSCTGCEACVYTCTGARSGEQSRVRIKSDEAEGSFHPVLCCGCMDMPCISVCTQEAIHFSRRVYIPLIDEDKCNGCGMCVNICPFEAIGFDRDSKRAFKCDLCGGDPVCAQACIPGAIRFLAFTKKSAIEKHLNAATLLENV